MDAIDFISKGTGKEIYDFECEIQKSTHTLHISKESIKRIKEFAGIIEKIRDISSLSPPYIVKATINLLNLDLLSHTHPKANNHPYLTRYIDAAKSWVKHFDTPIGDFLQWMEIRDRYADDEADELTEAGSLQILTLHASKGLEWDFVVMPFCCENKFPKYSRYRGWISELDIPYDLRLNSDQFPSFLWKHISSGQDLNKALTKPPESIYQSSYIANNSLQYSALCAKKAFDEERRLFYVGITRAKQGILITCAQNYDTKEQFLPSSFIKDAGIKVSSTVERISKTRTQLIQKELIQKEESHINPQIWPSTKTINDYARNIHIINRCIRIINRKRLKPSRGADLPLLQQAHLISAPASSRKNLQKE